MARQGFRDPTRGHQDISGVLGAHISLPEVKKGGATYIFIIGPFSSVSSAI